MVIKKDRNDMVLALSKEYNNKDLAIKFNVSRERVRQILEVYGVHNRRTRTRTRAILRSGLLGRMTDRDVASHFDVPDSVISYIRASNGILRYKRPIGCPKCVTHHYARSLCRTCYARAERHGILKKFPRRNRIIGGVTK